MKLADSPREKLGKQISEGIVNEGMLKTWMRGEPEGWRLHSGLWSPFYINLRLISSANPELYKLAGRAMSMLTFDAGFIPDGHTRIVGIAMAGIPIANVATVYSGIPSLYTRPDQKGHGESALVEGDMRDGDRLGLVDDVVTVFNSKLRAREKVLEEAGNRGISVTVNHVFVLFDREQGASEVAAANGMELHSFIPFATKGLHWMKDALHSDEYRVIGEYLENPSHFQDSQVQQELKDRVRREG